MTQVRSIQMTNPVALSESSLMATAISRPSVAFSLQPQTVTTQTSPQNNLLGLQAQQQAAGAMQQFTNVNPEPRCMCASQIDTQATHVSQRAAQGGPNQWTNGATQGTASAGMGPATARPDDQVLIPSLQALRSTAINQDLVQRRLDELHQQAAPQQTGNPSSTLAQDTCNKQSSKTKGKKEKVEVVWPQDCAFVGHQRTRLTYEQLNQSQFVLGFLRSVQE